jgi:cell wall-associated NlpC family hydrolase
VSLSLRTLSLSLVLALAAASLLAALPASARAVTGGAAAPSPTVRDSGGAAPGVVAGKRRRKPKPRRKARRVTRVAPAPEGAATATPPAPATLLADGTAAAPAGAPAAVAAVIAAGNRIATLPYRWGGGHASWEDSGYDCSGSVGYALHGGGLLRATATSGDLMSYGDPGPGTWITVYANADHVYMVVAGLRFDTSGARPSRWQSASRSADGYAVRHPAGF